MRDVNWDGAVNARDLGGLPTPLGPIQPGRLYRSARPEYLTERGCQDLVDAGVTTIIDLRNADERSAVRRIDGVTIHHLPIEDPTDAAFMAEWGERLDSPAYYSDALRRWPDRITALFAHVLEVDVGGLLIHCSGGCDRTGMVVAMLLAAVGTPVAAILDDYELAVRTMNTHAAQLGEAALSWASLDRHCALARDDLVAFLESADPAAYFTSGQMDGLRERLTTFDWQGLGLAAGCRNLWPGSPPALCTRTSGDHLREGRHPLAVLGFAEGGEFLVRHRHPVRFLAQGMQ
ncbi:tyrosine-protein phosphatase [Kribbella sp. NBC_00482]|uniref:tyrosine-protein phosphatase n=1 Tax=Kribbella sp. NBC_00482 TaxID=2975968 RepID=UPI002E189A7A